MSCMRSTSVMFSRVYACVCAYVCTVYARVCARCVCGVYTCLIYARCLRVVFAWCICMMYARCMPVCMRGVYTRVQVYTRVYARCICVHGVCAVHVCARRMRVCVCTTYAPCMRVRGVCSSAFPLPTRWRRSWEQIVSRGWSRRWVWLAAKT